MAVTVACRSGRLDGPHRRGRDPLQGYAHTQGRAMARASTSWAPGRDSRDPARTSRALQLKAHRAIKPSDKAPLCLSSAPPRRVHSDLRGFHIAQDGTSRYAPRGKRRHEIDRRFNSPSKAGCELQSRRTHSKCRWPTAVSYLINGAASTRRRRGRERGHTRDREDRGGVACPDRR